MRTFSAIETSEMLGDEAIAKANEWLARGDGIAVYVNSDLGSAEVGHRQFCSFGSKEAQFMAPPTQLPDFNGAVNWRYQLEGTYRGPQLEPPATHSWATPIAVLELITDSFKAKIIGRHDRLIGYGVEHRKYAEAGIVTFTLDVTGSEGVSPEHGHGEMQMAGRVLTPLVGTARITVSTLTNERGEVDRLGWFHWLIEGVDGGLQGDDGNLGSTIVNIHNLSMTKED